MIIEPAPTAEEAAAIAAALAVLAQRSTDLKVRGYGSKWGRTELKLRGYVRGESRDWRKTARREAVEPGV